VPDPARRLGRAAAVVLVDSYLVLLVSWLIVVALVGDRPAQLYVVNSLGVYWFAPLPVALAAALALRHGPGAALGVGAALVWLALFGPYFLPAFTPVPAGQPLRVMTSNLLGYNPDTAGAVAALRASAADVIGLNELSPATAEAVSTELRAEYPYQLLDPRRGVTGSGVISRYPLTPAAVPFPVDERVGVWMGPPLAVDVDVHGQVVTLVVFHTYSGPQWGSERRAAARYLADYAAAHPGPVIVMGDLNATELSIAYQTLTRPLRDAWAARGWGLGHTFPGSLVPGSSRPVIAGVPVPQWLVRIDFIFYSPGLAAASAAIGPWDGGSDHRPVLADLILER
jgi:endonuclease/exonuclease/phosphatase (EEP) superfamily protein YafD